MTEDLATPMLDGLSATEIRAYADGEVPGQIVNRIRRRTGLDLRSAMNVLDGFRAKHTTAQSGDLMRVGIGADRTLSATALDWATR